MTVSPLKKPALRLGPISFILQPRAIAVAGVLLLLLVLVFAASLGTGDYQLSLSRVLRTLAGEGSTLENTVIWKWRMARAVVGLAVGAALAFSGALTQTVARNPLASPDVLGITNGASVAAVFAIGFAGTGGVVGGFASFLLDGLGLPVVAIIGSTITASLIWFIAGSSRSSMIRLVLIGVGASIFLNAVTTWIIATTSLEQAATAKLWLTGSLNGRDWNQALLPLLALLIALLAAGWLSFQLSALSLGPTVAYILGHNIRIAQAAHLLIAVILSAVAVSAAGPIGFVAFIAPQIAQRLVNSATPPLICSALTGMLLVTGADLLARVVLPWELPVGIVTAFFGAPVLIYLVIRMNRKASA